jgi:hypothetical protein
MLAINMLFTHESGLAIVGPCVVEAPARIHFTLNAVDVAGVAYTASVVPVSWYRLHVAA